MQPSSRAFNMIAYAALCVAFLIAILDRLHYVHDSIRPFLQRAADPTLYNLSYGIPRSVVPNASPVFDWLTALRIDLVTPWFTVPVYLAVTALAGWLTWRLLRDVVKIDNPLERLVLVFALGFAESKFVEFSMAGWINHHNFTFTLVAATIRIGFLQALLTGKFRMAAMLLIVINLLTFKVGWPLLGFLGLVLLIERVKDPATWLAVLASMVSPLLAALQTRVALPPGEALAVFAALRGQHAAEDNPFGAMVITIPLFLAAMAAGYGLAGRLLTPVIAQRVRVILLASVGIFLVGGTYLQTGGLGAPIIAAVLLSPARAGETAALLVYLLLLVWVVRQPALLHAEKMVLVAALIVLKVQPGGKLMIAAFALAGLVAVGVLIRRRVGLAERIMLSGNRMPLGLWLVAPCLGVAGMLLVSSPGGIHVRYDPQLGLYDAKTPADALPMLRAIRADQGDRLIQFDRGPDDANFGFDWNYLVRKSALHYDFYYLGRFAEIAEQKRRDAIAEAVIGGIDAGRVAESARRDMAGLRATLVIRRDRLGAVPGWSVMHDYGAWVEVRP